MIECVAEDLALKHSIFRSLDDILRPEAILASNTSSLSITEIALATRRPDKVLGMHFFNPVPVMRLLELVRGLHTSDETMAMARKVGAYLGKTTITAPDSPGFIVNRLLIPYIVEAIGAYEAGLGEVAVVDNGVKLGMGHPLGPLALADLIGLDVTLAIADTLYAVVGQSLLQGAALAAAHGGRGAAGTQDRTWVLRVSPELREAGSPPGNGQGLSSGSEFHDFAQEGGKLGAFGFIQVAHEFGCDPFVDRAMRGHDGLAALGQVHVPGTGIGGGTLLAHVAVLRQPGQQRRDRGLGNLEHARQIGRRGFFHLRDQVQAGDLAHRQIGELAGLHRCALHPGNCAGNDVDDIGEGIGFGGHGRVVAILDAARWCHRKERAAAGHDRRLVHDHQTGQFGLSTER